MISAGNSLNSSEHFWWAAPIFFVFEYFWWVLALGIVFYFPILRIWWWFFLPIILCFPFQTFYLYWLRWDIWYKKEFQWIVLEIKPPKEVMKPFKAMEDVLELIWAIYDGPIWREIMCEGELPLGGGAWFSFEIVSLGGKIHFFARIPIKFRKTFETSFYAHYPELEIKEVDDYVKNVPQDIPNEKWGLLGEVYGFRREHCYPIKTYPAFFEERGEMIKEEKRIDPMNSLLENMTRLKEGEQFWFQIVLNPIIDEIPFRAEGKRIANKIARRPEEKKESVLAKELKKIFVPPSPGEVFPPERGRVLPTEEEKIEGISPGRTEAGEREMLITPRERMILSAIENKSSKMAFQTWMRGIYIFRKDKPFDTANLRVARTYLGHFKVADLNLFLQWGLTRTRIHWILRPRRLYLRKRKIFRNCIQRFPPLYPQVYEGGANDGKGTPVLNTEELATIFHFPTKIILPEVPRIEVKPGGPPPGLPVE